MPRFFLSRQWRLPKVILGLMIAELPFTVANLALFGIAAPNTYRTALWRYGGERGFNSDPNRVMYAAYNYKHVDTPVVWSSLNTNYNMYVGVVCMFFYLIKTTLWLLHIFYPILSLLLHLALAALWCGSIYLQTAPDTIDPEHLNKGAPWYITKNCAIVENSKLRGYCMQAKSAFAVSIVMLSIYTVLIVLSIYSLVPTPAARAAHASKLAEKKAEKELFASSPDDDAVPAHHMTPEQQWQHMWELQQLPRTPGTATGNAPWSSAPAHAPITPRTRAFEELQGGNAPYPVAGRQVYYPPPAEPVSPVGAYHQQQYQQQQQYDAPPPSGEQGLGVQHLQQPHDGKPMGTAV